MKKLTQKEFKEKLDKLYPNHQLEIINFTCSTGPLTVKCNNCGNLIHIDCDCIKELINHIYNEHNFRMSQEHIIINGICQECMKGMM